MIAQSFQQTKDGRKWGFSVMVDFNPIDSHSIKFSYSLPARIDLLKVNNRNTRTRCEVCSIQTLK